jgi:hypothetical protein
MYKGTRMSWIVPVAVPHKNHFLRISIDTVQSTTLKLPSAFIPDCEFSSYCTKGSHVMRVKIINTLLRYPVSRYPWYFLQALPVMLFCQIFDTVQSTTWKLPSESIPDCEYSSYCTKGSHFMKVKIINTLLLYPVSRCPWYILQTLPVIVLCQIFAV